MSPITIITLIVVAILVLTGILTYLVHGIKHTVKPSQMLLVDNLVSDASMAHTVLGTTNTIEMSFNVTVLFELFKKQLASTAGVVLQELKGKTVETSGSHYDDQFVWFQLTDAGGMKMLLRVELFDSKASNLLNNSQPIPAEYVKDGNTRLAGKLSVFVATESCGENCRTDIISGINQSAAKSVVNEVKTSDSKSRSWVFEFKQEGASFFIGETTIGLSAIDDSEWDIFYAKPTMTATMGTFTPPMSIQVNEIMEGIQKGRNYVVIGPNRVGKTTLVKNIVQRAGNAHVSVIRLDHDSLTANQPVIRATLENWIIDQQAKYGGEVKLLIIIDEATRVLNAKALPNLRELMDGFRKEDCTTSVILSMAAKKADIPTDVLAAGRCHQLVELGYLPEKQTKDIVRYLKIRGSKINETAVNNILANDTLSPKGYASIGEIIDLQASDDGGAVSEIMMQFMSTPTTSVDAGDV